MNPLALRSLLIHLHIRQWAGEVGDRKALQAVATSFKTDTKQDKYTKSLFVDDPLKMVKRVAGRIRLHFYRYALPWSDGGGRLIPSIQFQEFALGHKELVADFENEVIKFVGNYEDYKEAAKEAKGDLYNEDDYPHVDTLYSRFSIELITLPFPNVKDFRIEAPEAVIKQLKEEMKESVEKVSDSLNTIILDRIYTRVNSLLAALEADKKITQPSMDELTQALSPVAGLGDVLPDSTRILTAQIANQVTSYTAAQIRNSQTATRDIIRSLKSVQKT